MAFLCSRRTSIQSYLTMKGLATRWVRDITSTHWSLMQVLHVLQFIFSLSSFSAENAMIKTLQSFQPATNRCINAVVSGVKTCVSICFSSLQLHDFIHNDFLTGLKLACQSSHLAQGLFQLFTYLGGGGTNKMSWLKQVCF